MATSGDVESVTLAGRYFAVAGGSDVKIKLGGLEGDAMPNGDGVSARYKKTRVLWSIASLPVVTDPASDDLEFLQSLSDQLSPFACSITLADESVLLGTGAIQGEISMSTQEATTEIELRGEGKLTRG